ncbi:tRNA preQ1(34) S-adenosylmethionine ribosyltransferase-isomerase QueA [Synoicihabitans lomoniglobus]|uniref:S-adenosylmethionine:tRNA ribosyltransferase-isomerase n=1 Tax=Synoicihabitans lomoniglobus TaxID=2909285 RepID=A0AAF0CQ04_9BACT|nr:tRNA preQ1(34) S-adenosylmethionine ribosyltransferase-isomerase QueA [Opitutaceae bacterium LMO-M01]WED65948.1 tRNA preQ1(34) S-adenosylmethionine ribosyltransferase-isomerase QueA [Opitutaceae bacterium LMO-M01]
MTALATELFDYDLPEHLIAQAPSAQRDASRLLVVDRKTQQVTHRQFRDLPHFLGPSDVLIRNNAAVLPARLSAVRPTGGKVECFLLRAEVEQAAGESWWCLLRPGKRLPVGATFSRADAFHATVIRKADDGVALVQFTPTNATESVAAMANRCGRMPLPPYIGRSDEDQRSADDLERYQTVYADRQRQVAVAAPTAGLHFTPEIFTQLQTQGVVTAEVTLHVGLGTFRPVTTDLITDHDIHREIYEIPPLTQNHVLQGDKRRVAVGTTSVRALEHFCSQHTTPLDHPFLGEADIFIYPPRSFAGVDALVTNFHQPRSTLLCLVSALLTPGKTDGIDWIKEIYHEAIAEEYRFFSYGDAMLII